MIEELSKVLGITEPGIRLTITLFAAYALAAVYRWQFRQRIPAVQHTYFIVTGMALMFFNYGWDVYHSVIAIMVAYLICKFIGGTPTSVIVAFVFYMGYLLVGFYFTSTDDYDLTWTLPQCILTLRLIALVTDLYDGRRIKPEKMDASTKETALYECPSLPEIAAQTYFYSSFLVGPQYSLKRFRDFVNGRFEPPTITEKESWQRVKTAMARLCLGICYMFGHILIYPIYPTEYFTTEQFKNENFVWKLCITMIWLRAIMMRYQACWLVAEGSCILSGLAYNGRDKDGTVLWDAVRNMRMVKFEFGCNFQSVIESFNYNTNLWAAKYVFKRLRFLGNKTLSHISTLLFLSLWHGFHSGYLVCFAFEFACVIAEKEWSTSFGRNHRFQTLSRSPELLFPLWFFRKCMVVFGCGFGFLPFILLTADRWIEAYKGLYLFGWIGVMAAMATDKFIWKRKVDLGIVRMIV